MKRSIVLAFVVAALSTGCGGNTEKEAEEKQKDKYEQTKETLEETEKKNPKRFISVEGHDRKNLIGQTVIEGKVSNNAKIASYKDIDIELSFYSKTGTLLEKDHEVIYKMIAPGIKDDFKIKYYAPKGTDSVALKVIGAKTE